MAIERRIKITETAVAAYGKHHRTGHRLAVVGVSVLADNETDVEQMAPESDNTPASYVLFQSASLLSMAISYAERSRFGAVFIGHTQVTSQAIQTADRHSSAYVRM